MKEKIKLQEFAWYIHHDKLVEPLVEPIEKRIDYIKSYKPEEEIPLRLRLLKKVKGRLPDELVEAIKRVDEARKRYVEAGKKYDKSWKKYDETLKWKKHHAEEQEKFDEAWKRYVEAGKKYDKARMNFIKAKRKYDETFNIHRLEIGKLHSKECKNCPWNGKTIFSKV